MLELPTSASLQHNSDGHSGGEADRQLLSRRQQLSGVTSDFPANGTGDEEAPVRSHSMDMPDWFHEVITEHVYKTQADIQRMDKRAEEQALALLDQQCKLQQVASRLALLAETSAIGDHRHTGGKQMVAAEEPTAVREVAIPSASQRAGLSNVSQKTDEEFLRSWLNTFRPVDEKHFKQQLHQNRMEIELGLQTTMEQFRKELHETVVNCLEMTSKADAAARCTEQSGLVGLRKAMLEALRQDIHCLQAANDESARSSLLARLLEKEAQQRQFLRGLGQRQHSSDEKDDEDEDEESKALFMISQRSSRSSPRRMFEAKRRYLSNLVPIARIPSVSKKAGSSSNPKTDPRSSMTVKQMFGPQTLTDK